ncbi:MAG: hypothetical protein LAP38_06180 [Acidobacteriia bacterium]|nr:hypothetical protein [Terriglobia bacterium]
MAHCLSCNGLLTRRDAVCYVCGEPAPKLAKVTVAGKSSSNLSNFLFLGSLGFTTYSFLSQNKMSLQVSLGVSGVILFVKLVDWLRRQDFSSRKEKLSNKSAWI